MLDSIWTLWNETTGKTLIWNNRENFDLSSIEKPIDVLIEVDEDDVKSLYRVFPDLSKVLPPLLLPQSKLKNPQKKGNRK